MCKMQPAGEPSRNRLGMTLANKRNNNDNLSRLGDSDGRSERRSCYNEQKMTRQETDYDYDVSSLMKPS